MAGRSLSRRFFFWVRRWWQDYFAPRRRPVVRDIKLSLIQLEDRFSPTSMAAGALLETAPPQLNQLTSAMRSAPGEYPNLSDAIGVTASERIQLVFPTESLRHTATPPPIPTNDGFVATTPPPEEASFVPQSRSNEQLTALDSVFSQPSARPTRPPRPQDNNNVPNPQAQSSGGGGIGGVSTPNASGGGSGGASSGAGPAVTNANQFLSANLSSAGAPLPSAHAQGTAVTPAASSEVAAHSPPMTVLSQVQPADSPPSSSIMATGGTFNITEDALAGNMFDMVSGVSPLIQAVEGTAVTNVPVTTFTDANPTASVGDFTASISWGDGSAPTSGTIVALAGGGFSVNGTHTYTNAGSYSSQVTISETDSSQTITGAGTAVVSDAPLSATPTSFNATENVAVNNVGVATFTDANPDAVAANFTASIDWGDGSFTDSGVVSGSGGVFTVTGSHTFTEGGTFPVNVSIVDGSPLQGGSSAAVSSTATVADQPLTGMGVTVTPALTGSSTTLTAGFTDANTFDGSGSFMAQINWGDGSTDDAPVSGSNGNYTLSGSHVYDRPGSYPVAVTVTDAGGATVTQTTNATITAASLSATGTTLTATAGQAITTAQIAAFTDGNTDDMNDDFGSASGYTATVDWGDGTALDSSPTVDGDANGFYVFGSHTYANTGAFTATVTITNSDGVPTTTTSAIQVTTMTPTGTTFSASEGVASNNVTVANFTDTQPGSYTAVIDWSDGSTPTSGTVSGSGGNYSVTGSYTYADGGTYPVNVTITNAQGLSAVATGTANVSDAELTATPQSFSTPQGSALTNVTVATFTDANPMDQMGIGSYGASIDWGDGSPTDLGVITSSNGVYTVAGSHTYETQGSFSVVVTITDAGSATTTANSTATVTASVINAMGATLSAQENVALSNVTVASFTAPATGSYSATIDWGDGTTDSGTVTGSNGNYTVTGSHTYAEATGGQQFAITVTIADAAADTVTALGGATVDGGTLAATGTPIQLTEASELEFPTVATFTDTDPGYSAGDFTTTIDWGDGTATDMASVSGSNGSFTVTGYHPYAEEGTYTAKVTIADPNGNTTQTVSDTVTVADAALTVASQNNYLSATQNVALSGVPVVEFGDADPNDSSSEYTARISWGDGVETAGVVSGGGGLFSVSGSHTYTVSGTFNTSVIIVDAGGSRLVATGSVNVSPVPVYTVATCSDSNPNDTSFQATIDWGDGTPTTSGTISGDPLAFAVTGTHSYADEGGPYTVTVTITTQSGVTTVLSTLQVGDAPLAAAQAPAAPPAAPPAPVAQVPTVKVDFGAKLNATVVAQPLRIHIDDGFSARVVDPATGRTTLVANNLQKTIIPALDTNLIQGTITIGPANSAGIMGWVVPNGVKVWWHPKNDGPWVQVSPRTAPYMATGQPIPIAIQGINPGAGAITALFTTQAPGQQPVTTKVVLDYTIFTGLNVSGVVAPQQQLIKQLQSASGFTLTNDANGNVWVTAKPAFPILTYMQVFADNFYQILTNEDYVTYTVKVPTVTITAIAAPKNIPGFFDNYHAATFYPDNYDYLTNSDKANGPIYTAAAILHALEEQFATQIYNSPFLINPKATPENQVGGAYGRGVIAEELVLGGPQFGWGARQEKKLDVGNFSTTMTIEYIPNSGKKTTVELEYGNDNQQLVGVKITRPVL